MLLKLLLLRIVGITLIISGLMMVFTQVPGMLKKLPEKLLGMLPPWGKKR